MTVETLPFFLSLFSLVFLFIGQCQYFRVRSVVPYVFVPSQVRGLAAGVTEDTSSSRFGEVPLLSLEVDCTMLRTVTACSYKR